MPINISTLPPLCEPCILGKQANMVVPKSCKGQRVTKLLEKVHSDIMGPEDVWTPIGDLYALNFIDDLSQKDWVYPIHNKADAVIKFHKWEALVKAKTGCQVKIYCMDNGGEFTSQSFEGYLHAAGVRHKVTTPYTSAHNGKAERNHHTILSQA